METAKRSVALLIEWRMLERHGRNLLRVAPAPSTPEVEEALTGSPVAVVAGAQSGVMLTFSIRHLGTEVTRFSTAADPTSVAELDQVLVDAVTRVGGDRDRISEYEMDLRRPGDAEPMMTFVASRRSE